MKRLVSGVYQADGSPITAMATINPALCRKYGIEVEVEQRDEGSVPHVHVYHDSSRNPKNCSYIRLDVAEYSPHHKQNILLIISKINLSLRNRRISSFL